MPDLTLQTSARCTQELFGNLVGIAQPNVSELIARGTLQRDAPLGEWLLAYCANLREQAAGRAATGDIDLATERAHLAREQRERVAMQNAVTRRELAPVGVLETALARASSQVAAILEALPTQIKRREPDLSPTAFRHLTEEIVRARNIMAAADISLEDLVDGLGGDPASAEERPEAA